MSAELPPKQPEGEVKPGWSNGTVELLNPVELGWRLVQPLVEVTDGTRPQ